MAANDRFSANKARRIENAKNNHYLLVKKLTI